MPSLQQYHILYINLDNRPDRKRSIEKQLVTLGLKKRSAFKTKRIKGILGSDIHTHRIALAKESKPSSLNLDLLSDHNPLWLTSMLDD